MLNKYIKYTFCEENGSTIAIVYPNIPKEVMKELSKEYDEVKFKED